MIIAFSTVLGKLAVLVMLRPVSRVTHLRTKDILRCANTPTYFTTPIPFARSANTKHMITDLTVMVTVGIAPVLMAADGVMTPLAVSAVPNALSTILIANKLLAL